MGDEARPHPIEIGVRQRPAVDDRRRDHREPHPGRGQPVQLLVEPLGVAQREVRDRVQASGAVDGDGLAPPVPRPHVRPLRGKRARQLPLPQQAVVREQDRLVEAEPLERAEPARAGPSGRGGARRRSAARAGRPAGPPRGARRAGGLAGGLDLRESEARRRASYSHGLPASSSTKSDRVVAVRRVDVRCPQPPVLDEVLVRVDDCHDVPPDRSVQCAGRPYCSAMIASNSASGSRCPVPEISTVTSWIVPVNRNGAVYPSPIAGPCSHPHVRPAPVIE